MRYLKLILLVLIVSQIYAKPINNVHKVGVIKKWYPYYFIDKKNKPGGYAIEMFEAIADNMGLKFEYKVYNNWHELWKAVEKQEIDIIPNVGITKKRADSISFSKPLDTFHIGLFKRKDSYDIRTIEDLGSKNVAVVLRNVCTKLITDEITDSKISYKHYDRAIAALSSGEVDVMCYPKSLLEFYLREIDLDEDIVYFGKPLKEIKRAVGVLKKEEHLLKLIDQEIIRMKSSGEYEKIYSKWFGLHDRVEFTYEQILMISAALIVAIIVLISVLFFITLRNKWLLTQKELINEIEEQKSKIEKQNNIILTQSKIAAVGEMLGNIAHQWRQPLASISMNAANMRADAELGDEIDNEKIVKFSKDISAQCKYLSKTIDDFRNFFTSKGDDIAEVNIKETLLKVDNLVLDAFRNNNIKIIHELPDECVIRLNESTFIQSLINIYNNSKDAIKQNSIPDEERFLFVKLYKEDNNIILSIKDSGGGIKEDIIDKIFEPYFTTKFESKGTGIGLYMTHQIITKHLGARIFVKNLQYNYKGKKLKGAEFIISIPI